MIKTILWDIDGTVLDFFAAERKSLKECFSYFGIGECTDDMINTYSKINIGYWEKLERCEMTKDEVLNNRFVDFLKFYNITSVTAQEINERYENGLPDYIEFIENSYDVIKSFQGKYKQYAVTNGALSVQSRKLKDSGLNDILDDAFISDMVGYEKPSVKFFEHVLNNIDECKKDEIIIIGDSLTSDIRGANNIGIKCCWYNPLHKTPDKDVIIDYEIDAIDKIEDIVNKIS